MRTLFIEPGSPWENGCIESLNGKLRNELLNGEIFDTLTEAQVLIERWRQEYNRFRPHSSLGHKPRAPEVKFDLDPDKWKRPVYNQNVLVSVLKGGPDGCGHVIPASGEYTVEGALQPVVIDHTNDIGRYEDPNLWMLHTM